MSAMFKKVNGMLCTTWQLIKQCRQAQSTLPVAAAKERILGFYSTGPRLREADLDISDLLSSYAESPLLLICEVQVCASGP